MYALNSLVSMHSSDGPKFQRALSCCEHLWHRKREELLHKVVAASCVDSSEDLGLESCPCDQAGLWASTQLPNSGFPSWVAYSLWGTCSTNQAYCHGFPHLSKGASWESQDFIGMLAFTAMLCTHSERYLAWCALSGATSFHQVESLIRSFCYCIAFECESFSERSLWHPLSVNNEFSANC